MSLSVTRARVKEKCAITDTSYDTVIDNLMSELVPVIEFALNDSHLADTSNTGLQATLNLGALEIVCGEFIAQRFREDGMYEEVHIGEIQLVPKAKSPDDPSGLKVQGEARLRPFLKTDISGRAGAKVSAALAPEAQ